MTNVESDQTNLEAGNQANSQPSGQGGDKQSSQTSPSGELVSKSDFDQLKKELLAQISGLQGDKDRAVNRNSTAIDKILEQVGGLNLDEKQTEQLEKIRLQTSINALTEKVETLSGGTAPASPVQQTNEEFLQIINKAGQNANDPRVVDLSTKFHGDRIGFAVALGEMNASPASAPISPVASVTGSGMGGPPPQTDKSLADEYATNYTKALNEGRREDAQQMKIDARAQGIPVENYRMTHKPSY